MTDYISAELAATCAALGYYDGQNYHLDKHCLDVIKDLIKYLKRDDDNHTIRCFLGQTKLLQTDLVKIFIQHSDKLEIWDVLLRLVINLTSPAILIYNEQIPVEKTARTIYQQIISYLQGYKVVLSDDRVWQVISNRLGELLKIETLERSEDDEMLIDRILIFIRNVLQIPPDDNEKRVDSDVTIHDEVLFGLNASGMVDLLLFIASNSSEEQYHMQILEIMSLMLREQNAAHLAASGLQRSTMEKEKDELRLVAVRQKEMREKIEKVRKYAGSRHSRFGGTFVVQNMKAIGENQLICHKPFQKIEALQFGTDKKKISKPKNKRPMQDAVEERTSALSVRLFLKEFCVEFLRGAYNPVMRHVKSFMIDGGTSEAVKTSCYLWAMRFFMEFNRHYKFEVKYVSETISTEIFHVVQRQMEQFYEMIVVDKKRIPIWSRRLHLALKAYQELLHTLMAMDKSTDRGVRESSKIIKSNVFYVSEYRETILSQFLCFDEVKMSRQYLIDLMTTAHIFLKLLELFSGKGSRSLIVQKVKQKRSKAKNKKKAQEEKAPSKTLEERWDDVGPELSAVMQEANIPEVVPFDATLDIPIDEQKNDAMKRIQKLLRTKYPEQAVGLLRSAREVWPENDSFGRSGMPAEEEFLALREIFFADLGVVEEDPVPQRDESQEDIENALNYLPEVDDDEEEEEEDTGATVVEETNFNFNEFLHRFANVKIVKALSILLHCFDTNTAEVNHYVAKMLHRIAWDCKMPGMMFQASIFRIFQRILESKNPEHKELQKFAVFIIRRFAEVAEKNRKAYMELLFWKATRDANMVVDGYNEESATGAKVQRALWNETEEDELRTLFMEHQTNKYPQDLVDWILEHLINQDRTRRGVIKKLKEMYLFVNSKSVRSEVQKRLPKEWGEDEVAELTEIWEQVKDDDDPVDLIYNGLRIKRPKPKIKEKLLELGLAKDRKELRKKRSRKSNHGKSSWETQSASNSEEDSGSSDGETEKSSSRRSAVAASSSSKKPAKRTTSKKQPTVAYSDAQLSGLLKDVIDKHMREALEWIRESLQDALEDRDEESSEGIPLVPLTDYASTAMDTPSFQKLVRALGMMPPADEQESYWRIPANMLSSTIQKRCNLIDNALAGNFVVEETPKVSQTADSDAEHRHSDSDEGVDVLENIKKYFANKESENPDSQPPESEPTTSSNKKERKPRTSRPRKKSQTPTIAEEDNVESSKSQEGESGPNTSWKKKERKPRAPRKKPESSTIAEEGKEEGAESVEKETVPKKKSGRMKLLIVSSDSEIDRDDNDEGEGGKRNLSDGSDKENGVAKRRRLLDSDEEEMGSSMKHEHPSNRSRIIASDEEDKPSQEQNRDRKSFRVIMSDDED